MKDPRKQAVFIQTATYPCPPVIKNIKLARDMGYDVVFWGARRSKINMPKHAEEFPVRRLGIPYPSSSLWYLLGTPIFALLANFRLMAMRPSMVHASDLEGILSCILYKLLNPRRKVILNIHDNFSIRYAVRPWFKKAIKVFEGYLLRFADLVIIPDETRLDLLKPWKPRRHLVVPNTPADCGLSREKRPSAPPLRLILTGWMMWTRGYKIIGDIVAARKDVELVVVGAGADDVVEYIRGLPRTRFMGFISQSEVLEITKTAHLTVVFYDPSIEINRYASPNKLYDALAAGCPVLINEECAVSRQVSEWECGYRVKYGDVAAINRVIDDMLRNPGKVAEMGARAREIYESRFKWENIKGGISREIGEMCGMPGRKAELERVV